MNLLGSPPRCAINVDMMKACDFVDWEFLFDVMEYMEFPWKFMHWIKQ